MPQYVSEFYDAMERRIIHNISSNNISNGKIYFSLKPYSLETILTLLAQTENRDAKRNIVYYIRNLRFIHPNLNGKDIQKELKLHPSPIIGDILKAL